MDEKTTVEISNWHENFDARVYEIVDPNNTEAIEKAKEVAESTYDLDDIYMRHIRQENQRTQQRIQLLEDDLVRSKRRTAQHGIYIKNLNIIRSYLNMKFRQFWSQLSQNEEKISASVTLEMLKKYSNRTTIYGKEGYKFAVYVLENPQSNILGVSRETCKFYILLNEKMHPQFSPHIIVEKAIQEIKHEDINLQKEYNITDEVLDEIVNFENTILSIDRIS